jgi:hypothetical protein
LARNVLAVAYAWSAPPPFPAPPTPHAVAQSGLRVHGRHVCWLGNTWPWARCPKAGPAESNGLLAQGAVAVPVLHSLSPVGTGAPCSSSYRFAFSLFLPVDL